MNSDGASSKLVGDFKTVLEQLRQDFTNNGNPPFKHFFCPILHKDQPAELCEGHVVPEGLNAGSAWVPQRRDVDHFFGSAVEADFIACLNDRELDLMTLFTNPTTHLKHRPKVFMGDEEIGHYFPKDLKNVPPSHVPAKIVDKDGNPIKNIAFKMPQKAVDKLESEGTNDRFSIVLEQNYLPAVTASLIKAAHLTMFKIFGYQWVLSVAGRDFAQILRRFYELQDGKHEGGREAAKNYFAPYMSMIKPIFNMPPDDLAGTVNDNRLVALTNSRGEIFVSGIVIRSGKHLFVVFALGDRNTDAYFDFLKCPPASVAANIIELADEKWVQIRADRIRFEPNS